MSDTLSPEKLTAWQRWELPNFQAPHASQQPENIELTTAAQVEEIQRLAREEGYRAGHAEGMQQAASERQQLATIIEAMGKQVDEQVTQELVALALDVARQMLHTALKADPALVLNVVREAIGTLPHFNQGAHLVLHPADAALVREQMGEQLAHSGWKVFDDARIERGGARIETANSQIDATLEARWKHVVAALGQNTEWLIQE